MAVQTFKTARAKIVLKKLVRLASIDVLAAPSDTTGARAYRRNSYTANAQKDLLRSNEIRASGQVADEEHDIQYVEGGSSSADLYPGNSFDDFVCLLGVAGQRCLRKTVSASAGDGFTIANGSGADAGLSIVTRAAGGAESFVDDGILVGDIVSFTGLASNYDNGRPFEVRDVSATVLKLLPLGQAEQLREVSVADETAAVIVPISSVSATASTDTFALTRNTETGVITISRAGSSPGSFLADGFKRGLLVRLFTAPFRNFIVTSVTATQMTLIAVDAGYLPPEQAATGTFTITAPGKITYAPQQGREQWAHITEEHVLGEGSRLKLGEIPSQIVLRVAEASKVTVDATLIALRDLDAPTSPFFTSPTPAGIERGFSSALSLLYANGKRLAGATGVDLTIANGAAIFKGVGETIAQSITLGDIDVTGQFTRAASATNRDAWRSLFLQRTEFGQNLVFQQLATGLAAPEAVNCIMNRCQMNSNQPDDTNTGARIATNAFRALEYGSAAPADAFPDCFVLQDTSR